MWTDDKDHKEEEQKNGRRRRKWRRRERRKTRGKEIVKDNNECPLLPDKDEELRTRETCANVEFHHSSGRHPACILPHLSPPGEPP